MERKIYTVRVQYADLSHYQKGRATQEQAQPELWDGSLLLSEAGGALGLRAGHVTSAYKEDSALYAGRIFYKDQRAVSGRALDVRRMSVQRGLERRTTQLSESIEIAGLFSNQQPMHCFGSSDRALFKHYIFDDAVQKPVYIPLRNCLRIQPVVEQAGI